MAKKRTLAVDMSYVGAGTPGDGVEASEYKQYPEIDSVNFDFTEQKQVNFKAMGQVAPWAVIFKNGDPSAVEFGIPSPTPEEQQDFMGGKVVNGEWQAPIDPVKVTKSIKMKTAEYEGKYVEYKIPYATCSGRMSQAPGEEQTDILLVRAVIAIPTSSAGVKGSPWQRAVKDVAAPAPGPDPEGEGEGYE